MYLFYSTLTTAKDAECIQENPIQLIQAGYLLRN